MTHDGNFAMTNDKVGSGPNFVALEDAFHVFNDNNYSLNAQAYMNINFLEGLDLKITGSGVFTRILEKYIYRIPRFWSGAGESPTPGSICRHHEEPDVQRGFHV